MSGDRDAVLNPARHIAANVWLPIKQNDMKQISLIMMIVFLGCSSKSNNSKIDNVFVYDKKVEITLSDRFYLESSIIYDKDSNKIGEFLPGLITPIKRLSFMDIFKLSKDGGEIQSIETSFSYDDFQSKIIKVDSIQLTNYKWYCIVKQSSYEGASANDYGLWNCYNFITIDKDRILFVTFYDKDINSTLTDLQF
jgi:hypothetical protein